MTGSAAPKAPVVIPVIHTIPEKFIGAASGKAPLIREVVEKKIVEMNPPLPPTPVVPRPVPKKSRKWLIIGSVAVFLIGVGTAAYILLSSPKSVPVVNTNTLPPPPVVNVNIAPPPPAPVCGNSVIENGEMCDAGTQNGIVGSGCTSTCQIEVKKPVVIPNTGVDSDADGLTDAEETSVYKTDIHNIDTDGDTFNDGNEVSHLYDPNLKAPAMLYDSALMRKIESAVQKYSVLVPALWNMRGEGTEQFTATSNVTADSFGVLVTPKPNDQSLVEWYLAMSPGTAASDVERFKTLKGYDALRSPDRLTVYVDGGDGRVFTLSYNYDDQQTIEYRTTYEAFIASFSIIK